MEFTKKQIRNIFLGVGACIVMYWLLHEPERAESIYNFINKLFSPFIVGAALAFVLNVPMRAIEKGLGWIKISRLRRAISILLTFVAIALVIFAFVNLLIPQIRSTAQTLINELPDFFKRVRTEGVEVLNKFPEVKDWLKENTILDEVSGFDFAAAFEKVFSLLSTSLTSILSGTVSAIGSVASGIFNAVMSFAFALYALASKEVLARQGRRLLYSFLPEKVCDETIRILRLSNSTFSNFISGQCLEALILGCMFAVMMLILGMPYIPLVSVLISVTALVPIVGAFAGCILGTLFILVESPVQAFTFVLMFLAIQQVEGNLIYPRVVGTSIGLPGMWVLVAVTVGGELMGVAGMLLMIPLASVFYTVLREITQKRLAKRQINSEKLQDHPPELKSKFKERREHAKKKRMLKFMHKQKQEEEQK